MRELVETSEEVSDFISLSSRFEPFEEFLNKPFAFFIIKYITIYAIQEINVVVA
jgi:hypothetical protein